MSTTTTSAIAAPIATMFAILRAHDARRYAAPAGKIGIN
jgi:hypothetical protein